MGPLTPLIDSLLQDLKSGFKGKRSNLETLWPQIVGAKFNLHTKATLNPAGTLCVWVDQSVLASELRQRYQGTLLKRAQEAIGEKEVKKITFRVGQIR